MIVEFEEDYLRDPIKGELVTIENIVTSPKWSNVINVVLTT